MVFYSSLGSFKQFMYGFNVPQPDAPGKGS